jgi:hypothetical protein
MRRVACTAPQIFHQPCNQNHGTSCNNVARRYAEHKLIGTHNVVFILEFRVRPTTFDEGSHTLGEACLKEIDTNEFSPPNDSWEWFTVSFWSLHASHVVIKSICVKVYSFARIASELCN